MSTHDNADYDKARIRSWQAVCRSLWREPEPRCKRCDQPARHRWRGLCARCYLHAGGGS